MKKAISILLLLCIYAELLTACDPAVPITDEYTEKQDCQYMYGSSMEFRMCASEDSYYYLAPTGTIYLIDKQTLQCVPFCSKPNCSHDNSACTARTQSKGIWFYQDALYVTDPREDVTAETNELETYGLYRLSLGGTTKDLVRSVGSSILGGFIHRGYYYSNDFDGIRRYSLSDQESSELIFENDSNITYSVTSAYGNHLYISRSDIEKIHEDLFVEIEKWDTPVSICDVTRSSETNDSCLQENRISSFGGKTLVLTKVSVTDDYTKMYDGSVLITDQTGKNEEPIDYVQINKDTLMFGSFSADNKYCYHLYTPPFNGTKESWQNACFIVYDRNTEKKVEELPIFEQYGNPYGMYLGDERYLFLEFEPGCYYENEEYITISDPYRSLCVVDKQSIGKGASIRELIRVTP